MHALVKINQYREQKDGTDLVVSVPDLKLGDMFQRKKIRNAEIRFDDGRHISAEQSKKSICNYQRHFRLDRISSRRNERDIEVSAYDAYR